MNLLSLTTILILSLVVLCQTDFAEAECCKGDGKWGCCGFGQCNIFCCNCDTWNGQVCKPSNMCNFDPTVALQIVLGVGGMIGKRSTTDLHTFDKFVSIDTDSDGRISYDETVQWYATKNGLTLGVSKEVKQAVYAEFQKMDTNNDMFIGPHEFDHSL